MMKIVRRKAKQKKCLRVVILNQVERVMLKMLRKSLYSSILLPNYQLVTTRLTVRSLKSGRMIT